MYGFDRPPLERFVKMLKSYALFDFGQSFFRDRPVIDLVREKLPVSISLGLWTTVLVYLVSIPLGIAKAVRDGSAFDVWSSAVVIVGYAIPGSSSPSCSWCSSRAGASSTGSRSAGSCRPTGGRSRGRRASLDYLWHITLPVTALLAGGFAGLTMLTKNSFLEEIGKQYVVTARAKGLSRRRVLYGHVFRNAMLIVVAGFPAAFIGILFTGALLVEVIFSLDGLGLLGFEAAINRDYPVMFGTLYIYTLIGLLLNILSDLTYVAVDPRIDFERREG